MARKTVETAVVEGRAPSDDELPPWPKARTGS